MSSDASFNTSLSIQFVSFRIFETSRMNEFIKKGGEKRMMIEPGNEPRRL